MPDLEDTLKNAESSTEFLWYVNHKDVKRGWVCNDVTFHAYTITCRMHAAAAGPSRDPDSTGRPGSCCFVGLPPPTHTHGVSDQPGLGPRTLGHLCSLRGMTGRSADRRPGRLCQCALRGGRTSRPAADAHLFGRARGRSPGALSAASTQGPHLPASGPRETPRPATSRQGPGLVTAQGGVRACGRPARGKSPGEPQRCREGLRVTAPPSPQCPSVPAPRSPQAARGRRPSRGL